MSSSPSTAISTAASTLSAEGCAQFFLPRGEGSRSPLVSLVAREQLQKIIVRVRDDKAHAALAKYFSCRLPNNNKIVVLKDGILLWLGPDEVLFRSLEGAVPPLERVATLEKQLQKTFVAIVDVSDYYAVVRLKGARARSVLQKNCPLDLHESVFLEGDCAQSLCGKAPVLVNCVSADKFDIQVRVSLAAYLWELLAFSTRSERL